MTVLAVDAHAHVQRLVCVVKLATALEGCTTEDQGSVVRFLWSKGLNAVDIHKEIFTVYGRKCLSRKAAQNSVEKFTQGHSEVVDSVEQVRKWLRQQTSMLRVSTHR
jgi:hypothetical protein